ncbi:MAG TPA: alanine--tRNA ligase [Acidiferrobacteraceae bacterium]|nr:alanine--tRNA ligase [Acidiferrobacteraceae bacterium]
MNSNEIRARFLKFFEERGHRVVASSPLVPANDPTLLFTNAGMVQFKETFLGRERRSYKRAASSQRCVRAGGKHNDLENVGYTARHHTFFEMLGNFSFGDYFKRDAIRFAWEFLTVDLGLPPERLWITVYEEDDEAARLWLDEVRVDPARFSRIGAKDNFWSMGDTGPCGPCSEIFYDHGPEIAGGPPGSPDADGDRYVEIWNLVFMQYDRDVQGQYHPLPKPSVDTGMGLERVAAVLQGVHSNYEIDLFQHLIRAAATTLGCTDLADKSLNVLADHIRAAAFLVTDNVVPGNEGRGYVLRRIIRRALRHGHALGASEPFFYRLVGPLVEQMGMAYPELARERERVERVLRGEEERFAETLSQGLRILEDDIRSLRTPVIPGSTIFKLYDTYGFPVDLTADIAREQNLTLDMAGFEQAMAAQRERARAAGAFRTAYSGSAAGRPPTEFSGYETTVDEAVVHGLEREGQAVERLEAGQRGVLYLDRTPFYAESGGQIGDRGVLRGPKGEFVVEDTQKGYAHIGHVRSGVLVVGETVACEVDRDLRLAAAYNHSATHLLHAALKRVLGEHVQQKGSLVTAERLRFDFAHFEPLTQEQLDRIEREVNLAIRHNTDVATEVMPVDEALASGAVALFGEKYGDAVRVVRMGEFSTELCGGTHVQRTGDMGLFKIVAEAGVAAGIRRIEALTGARALDYLTGTERQVRRVAELLKTTPEEVDRRLDLLIQRVRGLEREVSQLQARHVANAGDELLSQAQDIKGTTVLAACIPHAEGKGLRELLDRLKDRVQSGAIVLAAVDDARRVSLVAGVTRDLAGRVHAGELVNHVARQVGGKGGGRPDMAQAGGTNPDGLNEALLSVPAWIERALA